LKSALKNAIIFQRTIVRLLLGGIVMPWKYILNIKLDNNVVYEREIDKKEICISDKEKELGYKNNINCELLPNGGDE